ncbi:MAG TPA: GrpB family protein [Gaiellaceae bacterium]|nr:GrpB family protein [Gaiellaceae bacterium]
MSGPTVSFVLSDLVSDETAAVFAAHASRIRARLPRVEVRHHGGTSLPGLLTQGDVDLHVRAARREFEPARDALGEFYEPLFPGEWDSDVAYFRAPDSQPPVEVVLTVIASLDDRYHHDAWQLIAADPALADRYNALKRRLEGSALDDYKAAKRDFFRELVASLGA